MKSLYLLFILFSCNFARLCAQQDHGSAKGTIKTADGYPAASVNVGLKGTAIATSSDNQGAFELKEIPPGQYLLVTSFVGLESKETEIDIRANQVTQVPEMILNEGISQLKEVIITAGSHRYNEDDPSPTLRLTSPLIELPQNIQVVTKDVLKDQQVISMSDGLIRNVSGVTRAEHWGDLYTNISSRGSQIQAFRNGFNVVNSSWGPLTEDMSFVDHIEFVKGPAGFMLSSGDPGGLYNVVTKKPTGQTKGEAGITVGSFGLYRTTLDLDGKLSKDGRLLYRLNLSAQNKNSHRPNEYNNRYVVAPVLSYQLDNHSRLTFEYDYQRANMSNIGSFYVFSLDGYGSLPVDFTSMPEGTPGQKIDDHSFYLHFQHDFNRDWKLTAQTSYFLYNQVGSSMWPSSIDSAGKLIREVDIWDARSNMTMAQVFLNGKINTGNVLHTVLGGIDIGNKKYLADWGQYHLLDNADDPFDPRNPDLGFPANGFPVFERSKPLAERALAAGGIMDLAYSSVYLQDQLAFFNNQVRLTLAGRYTSLRQSSWGAKPDSADHITPRVGLSVSVDHATSVYALYDQTFLPQSGKIASGGKVQPITGNSIEVGVKKNWLDDKWSTTLAFYRILKNNELTADPFSAPTLGLSIELGQKRAQGVEFDLRGSIVKGLNLTANYAYTDSRVVKVSPGITAVKVGDNVPGYAKHTANAWLSYKLQTGTLSGLGIQSGVTALLDRATYWEAAPDPAKELNDYYKWDAGLFWEKNSIKITANVFNLLNRYLYSGSFESWMTTPAYSYQTESPRNWRLSLSYTF